MKRGETDRAYVSAGRLVCGRIASRIHNKDASLYAFTDNAQDCAKKFMGWTDLASNPPLPIAEIQRFADEVVADGFETVVLIGQGGSTQAPMTITKYNKEDKNRVTFKTLDSDSAVRFRELYAGADPHKTLVIISSKSGGTIEPRMALLAIRAALADKMPEAEIPRHLVAITDPGSELEKMAREEGWRAVLLGEPTVGGRFSALSVFGLFPSALVGIDLNRFFDHAVEAERACSRDDYDNPAIQLAAFLYDNYLQGRNKFSLLTPKRGRVLGLWIEQLVAESLGKEGKGILPNIEVDPLVLTDDPHDRSILVYRTKTDQWDERMSFLMNLKYVDRKIPRIDFQIDTVDELAEHFVMWEYAIAMCGYLMKVCPFDQPDVSFAKEKVLAILSNGQTEPDFVVDSLGCVKVGGIEVRLGDAFKGCTSVAEALRQLFESVKPGDYFALNAFVPFSGEHRREALESIRSNVAKKLGVVSCLEVGPRYLHSTGQLQKGGMNDGVFLILSASELMDIPVHDKVDSLGDLAKAQAVGDLLTLSERGRRCVHVHLPNNAGITFKILADEVSKVLADFSD